MSFICDHILTLIVLSPFVAFLLLLAIPPASKTAARVTALTAGSISLILSVVACAQYFLGGLQGFQFREGFDWIKFGPAGFEPIRYSVGADGISLVMLLLTGIIIVAGVFASWTVENRAKEYLCLLMFLVTGVFGVFVSLDLFFLFLFYEIAVLPMYLLIGIWGAGRKEYAAMKLTLYLMLGSAFILTGILALYFLGPHTFDMLKITEGAGLSVEIQRLLFVAFYLGFGVLAGIFPFHTWSPDGHASAPTAVSMLHAGVLMKLGAYGVIRTCVAMFPATVVREFMPYVAIIACINIVYGAFSAMGQKDLKYVIAYSSVSHMGVVMLGIAGMNSVSVSGAVMQMFSHGIMTGLFFALVGLIYEKTHTRDITVMGGFAKQMPGIAVAFTVGGLASFGLPLTSGFVAESLAFMGTFRTYPVVTAVAVTGIVITAVYILRLVQRVFLGPTGKEWALLGDARKTEWVALGALSSLLVVVGVFPFPLVALINEGLRGLGLQ